MYDVNELQAPLVGVRKAEGTKGRREYRGERIPTDQHDTLSKQPKERTHSK